jgi:hypothetical protein
VPGRQRCAGRRRRAPGSRPRPRTSDTSSMGLAETSIRSHSFKVCPFAAWLDETPHHRPADVFTNRWRATRRCGTTRHTCWWKLEHHSPWAATHGALVEPAQQAGVEQNGIGRRPMIASQVAETDVVPVLVDGAFVLLGPRHPSSKRDRRARPIPATLLQVRAGETPTCPYRWCCSPCDRRRRDVSVGRGKVRCCPAAASGANRLCGKCRRRRPTGDSS